MRCFISALVALAFTAVASAQCRNGSCGPVCPIEPEQEEIVVHWRIYPDNPTQAFLHHGAKCVGGYDVSADFYRTYAAGKWGSESEPPARVPIFVSRVRIEQSPLPTGVDPNVLKDGENFSRKGNHVSKKEALRLIQATGPRTLPDDANRPHLTVIGKDSPTVQRINRDLAHASVSAVTKPYRVQVYDNSRKVDAMILEPFKLSEDSEFQSKGELWMAQSKETDGRGQVLMVLYGQQHIDGLCDAIRKADPSYTPAKPPVPVEPAKPEPPVTPPSAGTDKGFGAFAFTCVAGCLMPAWAFLRRRFNAGN